MDIDELIRSWIDNLTASEIPAALAYLRRADLTEESITDIQARIVRHWADLDTGAATAWVTAQPAGPARDQAMENVAIVGSNRELPAATAWARQLPPGAERDRMLAAVATEAARARPVEALRLAVDLPATPANDDLIRRAAMEWTAFDPSGCRDWAERIEDETLRGQVLSGVVIAWADADPAAAATYTADRIPAGRLQDDAIVGIAQRWAQQDPAAVAAWISTFPDGDLRTSATESVAAIGRVRRQD